MRNLKRALSLLLSSTMVLGMVVMGGSAVGYQDVDDTYHKEAIEVLQAAGIMTGVDSAGNFNPNGTVTRNEMAVIMANLMAYNVATYKDTSPFTDVPSWAEPYVAACWTNGITAGISATEYGGDQTVTTAQAALMIMKALGYFQYQSDFGGDWQLSTVSQGNKIDLFNDVNSGVKEAMTRNDVAQLVLNGLESGTVEAETNGSITVGDITIVNGVKYNFITSGQKYAYAINEALDTNNDATTSSGSIVELGEKLYQGDLAKKFSQDDFGRPASTWSYKNTEVGTYAYEADYTYTKGVSNKDLYNTLGSLIVDDTKNVEFKLYYNGEYRGNTRPVKNNTSTYSETATGTLTQVYILSDPETNTKDVYITMVDTFLAEVVRANKGDNSTTITLNYLDGIDGNQTNATARQATVTMDSTDLVDGDKVLVTLYKDGAQFSVASMEKAKTVTGTVTAVKSIYLDDNKYGSYAVMDDKQYDYVGNTFANDLADTDLDDPTINAEDTLYLDTYGNMIAFEATKRAVDYLYMQDCIKDLNGVKAAVTFADGTSETISINKYSYTTDGGTNYNELKNSAVAYDASTSIHGLKDGTVGVFAYVKQGSSYELTQIVDVNDDSTAKNIWGTVAASGKYDNGDSYEKSSTGALVSGTGTIAGDSSNVAKYTIKNGLNAIQYVKANNSTFAEGTPENVVSLTTSTIFVDVEGGVIYTGYNEVPTMTNIDFYVVYNKQLNADVVFITDGADNSTSDSYFLLAEDEPLTTKTEGGVTYRTYSAWVNGEKTTVTMKGISAASNGAFLKNNLYKIDTITPDGYITAATCLSVGAVPAAGDKTFSLEYSATNAVPTQKTSGTIRVENDSNIADCNNNVVTNYTSQRIYAYDNDTIFMQIQEDANGKKIVTRSSANAINTNDDNIPGNSNVYVVAVKDKDSRTPVATLVYVVNQYEGEFTEYQVNLSRGTYVTAATTLTNGGTPVASGSKVLQGSTLTLTPAVTSGYKVASVTVNGTPVAVNRDGSTYTITVTGTTNIVVTAALNTDVSATMNILSGARVVIGDKGYTSATQALTLTAGEEVHVQVQWGTVPAASRIVSWNGVALTDYSTNGDYYFTPAAGDASKVLEIGVDTYNLTLASNMTADWDYNGKTGTVSNTTPTAIPEGADVTMKVNAGTAYYVKNGTEYKKGGESFTAFEMTAPVSVSADKYHKITAVTVDASGSNVSTNLGGVTVGTSFAADTMVKQGVATNVVFTLGGSGTVANNAIKIQLSAVTGVTSSKYSTAQELLATTNTEATDISGKADTITIDGTATTADIAIEYTLSTT